MFKHIYIEENIFHHARTQNILKQFNDLEYTLIDKVENYWGRAKKPYLQKRDNLKLFIGHKFGDLVRVAPDAYGLTGAPHYYFVHAYNCIYECEYCYLQGHFNTPDIVLFINHEEIIAKMQELTDNTQGEIWFHAGEFSDSLNLSHITGELSLYHAFCAKNPRAKIELRTKSVNIKQVEKLAPLPNFITSFSLASHQSAALYDKKCPSIKARLRAIEKLASLGHPIGIHFDPVVLSDHFENEYREVINELFDILPQKLLAYISLGVVRFTKDVYFEVARNYPASSILAQDFKKSFDGKMRYEKPLRLWMLNKIKTMLVACDTPLQKIYLCMEDIQSTK